MKDPLKLDEFDFGFTMMDEDALDAVQEARQEAQTTSTELEQWKQRTETIHRMVLPLLKNLAANPEKAYIYWPDRVQKIQQFIEQLDKVAGK